MARSILQGHHAAQAVLLIVAGVVLLFLNLTYDPFLAITFFIMAIISFATLFVDPKIDIPFVRKRQPIINVLGVAIISFATYAIISTLFIPMLVQVSQAFGWQSIFEFQAGKLPIFQGSTYIGIFASSILIAFLENNFAIRIFELVHAFFLKLGAPLGLAAVIAIFLVGSLMTVLHFQRNLGGASSGAKLLNNFFFFETILTTSFIVKQQISPWVMHFGNNLGLAIYGILNGTIKVVSGGQA